MSIRARDFILLIMASWLVNGTVAALVAQPGYPDAYYYFNGGSLIAQGKGFTDPYLWNYVAAPPSLPVPAFTYWQPLASLIAALGISLFRFLPAFDAAQIAFVMLAMALPLLTYLIAYQLGERRHALLAGLLMVFSGYYVLYWSLPDSFTPFAVFGAVSLALAGWGRERVGVWVWMLSGAAAALGHLSRADGILLMGIIGLAALIPHGEVRFSRRAASAALAVLGYSLVMAPWWARNVIAFGSPQAADGLGMLWLLDYNAIFSYPATLSPTDYFAAGWDVILRAKWDALLGNMFTFIGVQNLVFLLPFTLIGGWRRWRHAWLLPAVLYGVALFAAMTFAFTLPGVRGGWFHSGAALMPFILPIAVVGIDDAVIWAARRRHWRIDSAKQVFAGATVFFAVALTIYLVIASIIGLPFDGSIRANRADRPYAQAAEMLDTMGVDPDARVMSNNPPGFYFHGGRGGVPIPNGDEAMLLRAADDYQIAYLVIDANIVEALAPLYFRGPASSRLVLVETFGDLQSPTYLYQIMP